MKNQAIAGLSALLLAGCAPDAYTNVKATGFNAFVDRVAVECAPLYAGQFVITPNFQDPAYDQNGYDIYDQWLDQTSRLYYKRIAPQAYLNNVGNLFGERSLESARCLVSKLPAPEQRPYAPTGRF